MALEKKFDKNALEMAALWFALHTIKIGPKLWRNIIMFLRKNTK